MREALLLLVVLVAIALMMGLLYAKPHEQTAEEKAYAEAVRKMMN